MKKVLYVLMLAFGVVTAAATKQNTAHISAAEAAINRLEFQLNSRAASIEGYLHNQLKAERGVLAKKKTTEESLVTARNLAQAAVDNLRQSAKAIANGLRDSLAKPAPDTEMVQ